MANTVPVISGDKQFVKLNLREVFVGESGARWQTRQQDYY